MQQLESAMTPHPRFIKALQGQALQLAGVRAPPPPVHLRRKCTTMSLLLTFRTQRVQLSTSLLEPSIRMVLPQSLG